MLFSEVFLLDLYPIGPIALILDINHWIFLARHPGHPPELLGSGVFSEPSDSTFRTTMASCTKASASGSDQLKCPRSAATSSTATEPVDAMANAWWPVRVSKGGVTGSCFCEMIYIYIYIQYISYKHTIIFSYNYHIYICTYIQESKRIAPFW